jgi:hypothetical protein
MQVALELQSLSLRWLKEKRDERHLKWLLLRLQRLVDGHLITPKHGLEKIHH